MTQETPWEKAVSADGTTALRTSAGELGTQGISEPLELSRKLPLQVGTSR